MERKDVLMSIRRLLATAGGMMMALAVTPRAPLHAQIGELRQDSRFILDAASSNLLEIRLGQQAQSRASSPAVKQFGQQMVTDHTNLHNQLTALLSKNTEFKPGMTDEDEEEVERLEKLSGTEFDRAYMTATAQHHQEEVAAFQSQQTSARSAEARQIATNGLPIQQRHLNMAIQVANQIGVNTGAVATTPPTPPTGTPPVTTGTPPVATPPQQPGPVTTQGDPSEIRADMGFIREAGSSNAMEIRLGQVAQSRGSNSAVKQFAQRMVTDHTNLQQQLSTLASSAGVSFVPALDSDHERQVNRVERFSGAEFDRAYMRLMIQAHQNDVDQFRTQSQSARSAQVRTLASQTLPLLEQHRSLAVQVGAQVGADTTQIATGPDRRRGDRDDRGGAGVRADAEFIRDVGADNAMQIELAKLAEDRASSRAVRQYAEREKRDHERLQDQWVEMGKRNDMKISAKGMGELHRDKVEQLKDVRGRNFDRAYMTMMIRQHSDEVSYWRKEGRDSQSPRVRELVNRGLPTLERHFEEAKQIGRQVGVNPEMVLRNRTDLTREKNKDRDRERD
jgi:putative membrane protein